MTSQDFEKAFIDAAKDFDSLLESLRPFRNENEGYCEANLVEYYSHALRRYHFRPFLELPVPKGRVDGLFYRGSTFLLLEAKQFHRGNAAYVNADLTRLALLDLPKLLQEYGLSGEITEVFHMALCDCWSKMEVERWLASVPVHPFLTGYKTKASFLPHGHPNRTYAWLLAYKEVSPFAVARPPSMQYPLRGSPVTLLAPTEPVAETDWEVAG